MGQVVVGVDPHKLSAAIEVIDADETFLGSCDRGQGDRCACCPDDQGCVAEFDGLRERPTRERPERCDASSGVVGGRRRVSGWGDSSAR
jgi:hypothetical protein